MVGVHGRTNPFTSQQVCRLKRRGGAEVPLHLLRTVRRVPIRPHFWELHHFPTGGALRFLANQRQRLYILIISSHIKNLKYTCLHSQVSN